MSEAKPSLREIAEMPYPASLLAMRQHYNPEWGKPIPDGAKLRTFRVKVEYSYSVSERETVEVEAFTKEEAEDKACEQISLKTPSEYDIEFDFCEAREEGQ